MTIVPVFFAALLASAPSPPEQLWNLAFHTANDIDKPTVAALALAKSNVTIDTAATVDPAATHKLSIELPGSRLYSAMEMANDRPLRSDLRMNVVAGLQLVLRNVPSQAFNVPSKMEIKAWKSYCWNNGNPSTVIFNLSVKSLTILPNGTLSADLVEGEIIPSKASDKLAALRILTRDSALPVIERWFVYPQIKTCEIWAVVRTKDAPPSSCLDALSSYSINDDEFEQKKREDEARPKVTALRAKTKKAPHSIELLLRAELTEYSFKDGGYVLELRNILQDSDGIAVVQRRQVPVILKMSPATAEAEVAWRRRIIDMTYKALPLYLIASADLHGAYLPHETKMLPRPRPLYIGRDPPSELLVDIRSAQVISEDGYVLGTARP